MACNAHAEVSSGCSYHKARYKFKVQSKWGIENWRKSIAKGVIQKKKAIQYVNLLYHIEIEKSGAFFIYGYGDLSNCLGSS